MSGLHAIKVPAAQRKATLVSVDGRTYPLEAARVVAEVSGGIACSKLVQTYRNPYAEPLEVIYTLPLPADGAVIGYAMRLGERVIRGEVRSRKVAKADYEKALFEGRSAALLEQDRDNTFTQRLGALPVGQSAEITIEVLHPLAFLAGVSEYGPQWEYRFPTVVGVRYEGAAGRVRDADRLELDRSETAGEIPVRIDLELTMITADGAAVRSVDTMRLDRDIVHRWDAGSDAVSARLVEGPGLSGDDGRYGMLTITPPRVPEAAFARDLTLLVDASGSMMGRPIAWAKDVAAGVLRSLGDGDRFEVIAFSGQPRSLTGGIVPATETALGAALDELSRVEAGGGTEMVDAMVRALWPLRPDSQHQVVLITDGEIGFEDEVVARIVSGLPDGARLHTVGVGSAPNRTLTSRAARAGRGVESFVCGDDEVPAAVKRLVVATARPVLTDLTIASSAIRGIAPARPRDVLAGQPLVVAVELDPKGGALEVTGRIAGSVEPWTWQLAVPPLGARQGAVTAVPLGALYGRESIADCELSPGRSDERVMEIAMRHRIASRVTSLVAIAEEPTVDPRMPRRTVVLPVELPAFVSAEGSGLKARSGVRAMMSMDDSAELAFHDLAFRRRSETRTLASREIPRSTRSGWLGRILGAGGVTPLTAVLRGRVIAVHALVLTIEIEAPSDGFLIPEGIVAVAHGGEEIGSGTIDPIGSSPRGPHAKGLVLRIVIIGSTSWMCFRGDDITIGRVTA